MLGFIRGFMAGMGYELGSSGDAYKRARICPLAYAKGWRIGRRWYLANKGAWDAW